MIFCSKYAILLVSNKFLEDEKMSKVILRQEKVTIPTYELSDYDKNPMFLEKRV